MTEDEMTAGARFTAERDGEWTVVTMRVPHNPGAHHARLGAWRGEDAKLRIALFFLGNTASLVTALGAPSLGDALAFLGARLEHSARQENVS